MKQYRTIGLVGLGVMLVIATMTYLWRGQIRDWWHTYNDEPLPTAVNYNNVRNTEGTEGTEITENKNTENANVNTSNANANSNTNTVAANVNTTVTIPDSINLDIPFSSQAPTGNWDALHEEACEETSVLMAARFLQGRGITDAQDAESAIQTLTSYVDETMHLPVDITAEQTKQLIEQYYNFHADVIYDWTWDDVKQALAQGYPVLVPSAGRMLGNPNYTGAGPLYHMLVIKGYTKSKIITNDSGTRHGADYQYSYDTIANASHDWNGGDVPNGKKVIVIVRP